MKLTGLKAKLPFVTRKRYMNERGWTIAYIPIGQKEVEPWHFDDKHAYHDRRIGWVRPRKFKTYGDYIEYLKTIPESEPHLIAEISKGNKK